MIKFQELKVDLSKNSEEVVIEKILKNLDNITWKRNMSSENELSGSVTINQYCFDYFKNSSMVAKLWIVKIENKLSVSNIVPHQSSQLSILEYNEILNNFVNSVLIKTGILYEVSKESPTAEDLLSKNSKESFFAFSNYANKSSGRYHPADEERWFKFIYATLKNKDELDSETVRNLLIDDGWDSETAYNLGKDYSYAYDAMKFVIIETERKVKR